MKYITNLIAIGIVALLVFGAMQFKKSNAYVTLRWRLESFFQRSKNFVEARKRNIREEMKPARERPITFIQIQGELQNWMPDVFLEEFTDRDWAYMWNLIYKPDRIREGIFYKYRYKSRSEVEAILRSQHQNLTYLNDADWWELWSIAKVKWEDEQE